MNRWSVAAALLLLAACSHTPPASVSTEVCSQDLARFCAGVEPGQGRLLACLRQRSSEITPACRVAVESPRDAQLALDRACHATADALCPGLSGTAAFECLRWRYADLPQACKDAMWVSQEKYDQFKAVCASDLSRFCGGASQAEGQLVACLRSRAAELQPLCRELINP